MPPSVYMRWIKGAKLIDDGRSVRFDVVNLGEEVEVGEYCWLDGDAMRREWLVPLQEFWSRVRVQVEGRERRRIVEEEREKEKEAERKARGDVEEKEEDAKAELEEMGPGSEMKL
ncbi:hypothetical protein TI39_contig4244g00024 [Zymoseptoria brevis]|uniref:Uncharacterized protein n=1 Tax=Zymoseptoria brevis TaxID=1047168 RepID=A0A0F4G959_9PEZI|nr:hypothetical protein TI39_contig4244g00024 [Zymoseptoria brevis]